MYTVADMNCSNDQQIRHDHWTTARTLSVWQLTSAASVANAAPLTPIANEKINIGSSTALNMLANALIFTGVPVSKIPFVRTRFGMVKSD
jgi:hypothetical protein